MIRKHLVHCLREVHRCRTFPLPVGPRLAELALEQVLTLATSLSKGGDMLDERKRPTVDLIPSLIPA
jgi:hypothetical protein